MKFPKIFGKKKDEDEDFDEDDFDVEELEEDFDDELEEALGASASREADGLDDDEHDDDEPEAERPVSTQAPIADDDDHEEEMVGSDDTVVNPFDGHDDDDEYDDEDDDDDDDEYEDEGSDKKKAIIFAAVGFGVLLISILGGAGWWFFSDPAVEAKAPESAPGSVEMAMPAPPGSLNAGGVGSLNNLAGSPATAPMNAAAGNEPASATVPAETAPAAASASPTQTEGMAFAPAATGAAPAGGLNSLNNLNALGGTSSAGGGLVVPAVAGPAMAKIADQPTATDQSQALSGAPVRGLLEEKDGIGELPKISNAGAVPWQVYARPSDPGITEPKIALMIEGIGLSRQASLGAINKLPAEISMVLSPYGRDLNDWVFRSRLAGHEVFVSLPMESDDFPLEDAGPLALDTRIQLAENQRRLDSVMASAAGYVGLVTYMGSRFMKAETQMRQLFTNIGQRGVMFVIGGSRSRNDAMPVAKELKLINAESEMYIDDVPRIQQIRTNLDRLESIAKERGSVLATARPYPVTIKSILDWYETIKDKGVVLVPVSAIANIPATE